jgi:O-antigen/teichoic acid export membrane protein
MTIAIARKADILEFGAFGLAMALYLLMVGLVRAAVTDTTLSLERSNVLLRSGFQKALLLSLFGGLAMVLVGFLTSVSFYWVLGMALPGLIALDYIRVTNSAMYRPWISLSIGIAWTCCSLAISITALVQPISPSWLFGLWCASGALIGGVSWAFSRLPALPVWRRSKDEDRAAVWFSIDYLAGSGGALLTTGLLGATLSPALVGALRGAGTLFGPANLLATTARSLSLPYLTKARASSDSGELRAAVLVTVALVLAMMPILLVIVFLPSEIGVQLLGETWALASIVLLPLAIESVLALVGSVASSGHRSRLAGGRAVILRLSMGACRPILVFLAAATWGAQGAAWGMVLISCINVVAWWASYIHLTKTPVRYASLARRSSAS